MVGRRFGSGLTTMCDGMPPCVTIVGVTVTMEVKEQRCGGLLMSSGQGESVKEAWSLPIQWRARKRGEAPPSGLGA